MSTSVTTEVSETILDGDILASREAGGRYLRGGSMRIVAYCSGLLVGLISTPLVTRHLGPIDWGRFITVTSLIIIVAALTEGGVGNFGVQQFAVGDEASRRSFMSNLIGLRIVLSLTGAAAAIAFAMIAGYPQVVVEGTALACVNLVLEALRTTLAVPLTARLRLGWLAVCDFLGQFVTAVFMVALVVGDASLLPFYTVGILTALVTFTLTVVLVRKEISFRPSFSLTRWRSLMSESIVYAAATALGFIYFRIVVIAMSLLAHKTQTGYFSLSFRILDIVNGIPWLLVASAFPILSRAARDDDERLRYALQKMFDGSVVLGACISLCVIVGAPFAVAVVGGPEYHASVVPLEIMGAGITGTFLVATGSFALLTLRRYRDLIVVNALIVALAAVLSLILIPSHQVDGAAVMTATLEIVLAGSYAFVVGRRRPDLRPSLQLVPRVALAFALALATGETLPLPAVAATIVSAVVMVTCLLALRAVPAEFFQALRRQSVNG